MPSSSLRFSVFCFVTLLLGCAQTGTMFTNDVRGRRNLKELQDLRYYTSANIDFVSAQTNIPTREKPLNDPNAKHLTVSREMPGTAVDAGPGWIAVDFGQGIVLTFRLSTDGVYVIPAWGTITVEGERYDFKMGVLTGTMVSLEYKPASP
jgi:hypothetical protein